MRIKELHKILQELKNGKVTQNDIARAIGTSRANVSKLFKNNSFINDEKIEKIEKYFEIKFSSSEDIIFAKYFPESVVEFENGKCIMSKKYVKCSIPASFFNAGKNEEYIMCHAPDNSMSPYVLDGDMVIIEGSKDFINNKIYGFIYKGIFYIRRLSANINQIVVLSDNQAYQPQCIEENEMKDFRLLGKVVYIGRTNI